MNPILIALLIITLVIIVVQLLTIRKRNIRITAILAEKSANAQEYEEQIAGLNRYIGRLDTTYEEDTEYLRTRALSAEENLTDALARVERAESELESTRAQLKALESENEHILATNMAADLAVKLVEDCKATLRESEIAEKEAQLRMICLHPPVKRTAFSHIH